MELGEQKRKPLLQSSRYVRAQLGALMNSGAVGVQINHAEIIRLGALEEEAEQLSEALASWSSRKAAAMQALELVVGLDVRRTVSPATQDLVKALAARGLSLKYVALASGLSEGTVSKLRSGTYPVSSFPVTVKVGRRGARR